MTVSLQNWGLLCWEATSGGVKSGVSCVSQQLSLSALVHAWCARKIVFIACLKKPIANTERLLWCFSVIVMTFKAYVTAVMHKLTCFVSQGKVRTAIRKGGQFCYSFVENLLLYLFAKNYRNTKWFDKNKNGAIFWLHSVDLFQKR